MHAMFFGIKRVHLRVLAITRPLLREAGLTPARFDMLRIVSKHPQGILQRNIQYLLGVSAATVSRMLRALESLGNVVRRRYEGDRRQVLVCLTGLGVNALMVAHADTIEPAIDLRMAAHAVTGDPSVDHRSRRALRRIRRVEDLLMQARRAYADPSPVRHPWASALVAFMEEKRYLDGTLDYPTRKRPLRRIREELPLSAGHYTFSFEPIASWRAPAYAC